MTRQDGRIDDADARTTDTAFTETKEGEPEMTTPILSPTAWLMLAALAATPLAGAQERAGGGE